MKKTATTTPGATVVKSRYYARLGKTVRTYADGHKEIVNWPTTDRFLAEMGV